MSTNGEFPSSTNPPREPAKPLEPPPQAATPTPTASPRTKRFLNWKLIGVEFIVTALGGFAFLTRAPRLPGMVVGLLGLSLLSREHRGIAVNSQVISLPTGRLRALPIIHLGRRKVHPGVVRELMVTHTWGSFQIVQIGRFRIGSARFPRPRTASAVHESHRKNQSGCPDVLEMPPPAAM
jgi:hypothetical protein